MLEKLNLSIEHASWLEEKRKIPSEIAAEAGVVSNGNALGFEYRQNGACMFRKMRREVIAGDQVTKTFWIEPKGAELLLWNEDCLSETVNAPLIMTEGELDALSFLTIGAGPVVSVPNGANLAKPGEGDIKPMEDTAFKYLWDGGKLKRGLRQFGKVILATDDDAKGRILRDELALRLGPTRCWFVTYPAGCKDANDVLMRHGTEALVDLIADAKPFVPNRLVRFSDIPSRADAPRYSSGWPGLDSHLMLVPPELVIVTGSPGAGKSQWALALVANLARLCGLKGAILQFEDNPERNRRDLFRYARSWSNQDRLDMPNGIHGEPVAWVDMMFRTIAPSESLDESEDFNLVWVRSAIEEAACRHDAKWVLIDPWNEIEHVWRINETETAYTNQALRELKRLARRYRIILIVVVHPTKGGAMSKGIADLSLYDCSGSAAWKNKADHGIIVYREDQAAADTHIKIDKSKDYWLMGKPGVVRMRFAPDRASFDFVGYGL